MTLRHITLSTNTLLYSPSVCTSSQYSFSCALLFHLLLFSGQLNYLPLLWSNSLLLVLTKLTTQHSVASCSYWWLRRAVENHDSHTVHAVYLALKLFCFYVIASIAEVLKRVNYWCQFQMQIHVMKTMLCCADMLFALIISNEINESPL